MMSEDEIVEQKRKDIIKWFAGNMPEGFFAYLVDDSQEVLYVNKAACHLFGCDTKEEFEDLTGNTFPGMVHQNDRRRVLGDVDRLLEKENTNRDPIEYRILAKDGSVKYVDHYVHSTEMTEYGRVCYAFIVDVTEKKHVRETEAANRAKTAFLTNMSHDMRTPMNAIVGFTDMALMNIEDRELIKEYLEKIKLSGEHLLLLINDVLEMSQIESGSMHLNEVPADLSEILDNLASIIKGEVEDKQQELLIDISKVTNKEIICDKLRLDQVLLNLISNAVKHTPNGGTVSLSIAQGTAGADERSVYMFRIKDSGSGIEPEYIEKIFEPFEKRRGSTDGEMPDLGLGMVITKRIIEMMDGSINVKSMPGEGTEFIVRLTFKTLPSRETIIREESRNRRKEEDFKGCRLLLVEDIVVNREIALAMLSIYGFQVEVACDGMEALEKIEKLGVDSFDAILMDIEMPRMNGYDATRAIRALPDTKAKSIPILALTANALAEDKQLSLEAGMNAHIAKPIDRDNLVETLERFLV